jgi:[glutamine synthetase] adenylyltransferase / [glutamine synthetase]-adenylyl-L-tyrosine phosphorylase
MGDSAEALVLPVVDPVQGNLLRSLDETSPALASVVAAAGLSRGLRAFEHFLERAAASPEAMRLLEERPGISAAVLDIFEHSPYFAEQFVRDPELVAQAAGLPAGDEAVVHAGRSAALSSGARWCAFRRIAFAAISRIRYARAHVRPRRYRDCFGVSDGGGADPASRPPKKAEYEARDQLMIVALGRLGMREFDLASDADLVFILPDSDHVETVFWTQVAERTIDILTAYTGDGVVFAVDTRLRPNGSAGALVQTVSAYHDYFARNAEAWEGIAWMKSRAIAGNIEAATRS